MKTKTPSPIPRSVPSNTDASMPPCADIPQDSALRLKAEECIRKKAAPSPENIVSLSPEETRKMIHELQVHQIELEMQNEELRAAQEELDVVLARYFDLYDLAPLGYCTISAKGMMLEANIAVATMLGLPRGALLNQPFSRFILTEDQDIYYLSHKRLLESGEPQMCELRMQKKDGTAFWASLASSAVQDADGMSACRIMLNDITAHKRAECLLQDTQNLLNEVGRIAKIGGWKMDLVARKATWTQGTYDIVEIVPGEPIPGPDEYEQYYLPEYRPLVREAMRALVENDILFDFTAPLRTAKGNVKWCHALARVIRKGGKAVEVYGTFQDVTEQKQAEEALQFRNILLSTQQEASIDGILVVDENARILLYNRRFVEILAIPAKIVEDGADEPLLQFVANQVADSRSFLQRVQYLYEHKHETSRDELVLSNGRAFDRYSAPMFGPKERYYGRVWYFRDITERKQAESEKARQLDELRRWQAVTLGREGRINDLKQEVNALAVRLGETPRYGCAAAN